LDFPNNMRVVLPALLLASACGVGATTLVAVWSPERLILGADSLMVTDTAKASACKIEHEGPIYFALSGLVQDRTAGFDLAPLRLSRGSVRRCRRRCSRSSISRLAITNICRRGIL
jgi:hypothetical protein